MANVSFNAVIGRKRLAESLNTNIVRDTRSARAGMANVLKNYKKFIDTVDEILPEVLYNALVPTFNLSQVYCPTDTGTMKASGYLEITSFRGKARVEMGYGVGGNPPYTARVHEATEWKHKAPTRSKWLQVAIEETSDDIQRNIVNALKV